MLTALSGIIAYDLWFLIMVVMLLNKTTGSLHIEISSTLSFVRGSASHPLLLPTLLLAKADMRMPWNQAWKRHDLPSSPSQDNT